MPSSPPGSASPASAGRPGDGANLRRELPLGVVYDDPPEHVALLLRTLQIEPSVWDSVLDTYADTLSEAEFAQPSERLAVLARAYARHSPHAAPVTEAFHGVRCAVCAGTNVVACARREPGNIVYGRCTSCGHGHLLAGKRTDPYRDTAYYERRDPEGVGYDAYRSEQRYREGKGQRLCERLIQIAGRVPGRLLEVGSGYGFTRGAAERLGIRSVGVDPNPEAARVARELYGLETFSGTLSDALSSAAPALSEAFDVVLYQFVLEHIDDVKAELARAASVLRPGGLLVLWVPSMDALEIEVFGASYRSFRADHLHLFSKVSLERLLSPAFEPAVLESGCQMHLLRGFVEQEWLDEVYRSGRGPDWFVCARRT